MPNMEMILGGLFAVISAMIGVVWSLLRSEAQNHAELIKDKAETSELKEVEERFKLELNSVREANEKLVNKLEAKHDKEIEQLSARLSEQIRSTEANILTQLRLMFEMVKKQGN